MKKILLLTISMLLTLSAWADGYERGTLFYADGDVYWVGVPATATSPGKAYLKKLFSDDELVKIPSTVEAGGYTYEVYCIDKEAIVDKPNLKELWIPETVIGVLDYAVHDNPNLNAVYIKGNNVGKISKRGFGDVDNSINYLVLDPEQADEMLSNSTLRYYFTTFRWIVYSRHNIGNVEYVYHHTDDYYHHMSGYAVTVSPGNTKVELKGSFALNQRLHVVSMYSSNFKQSVKDNSANIKTVEIQRTVCPDGLFADCKGITEVVVAETCGSIGKDIFSGCTNLAKLDMEQASNLKTIGENAFKGCTSLKELKMPTNFKSFGDNCFKGCTSLQTVNAEGLSQFTKIGNDAFSGCTSLTEFNCANSALSEIGSYAFATCSSLAKFNFQTLKELTSIGAYAFYGNKALKTYVTINSNKFRSLGNSAFDGSAITSIDLPASLTEVGMMPFGQCQNLTQAVFRGTNIGSYTFLNTVNLERVYLYGNVTSLNNAPFMNCGKLKLVMINSATPPTYTGNAPFAADRSGMTLLIPNYSALMAYSKADCYKDFGLIQTDTEDHDGLYFGAQIENQGEPEAFFDGIGSEMDDVTELNIPSQVMIEGKYDLPVNVVAANATWDHYWFTSVTIPETIRYIGDGAFKYQKFEYVEIPGNVKYIGEKAFGNIETLKKVRCYVKNNVSTLAHQDAFLDSPISTATLEVPTGTASMYRSALPWKYFGTINAVNLNGIDGVEVDNTDADARWYNLQGIEVNPANLTPGIYIHAGKKVVVK